MALLNKHIDELELCADFLSIGVANTKMSCCLADTQSLVIDRKLDERLSLALIC